MSTVFTVDTAFTDAELLGKAVAECLPEVLKLRNNIDITVTYNPQKQEVVQHASERSKVNAGVLTFSDTPYEVGLKRNEKTGLITLIYDSWVGGGMLSERVNGAKTEKSAANFVTCEGMYRMKQEAGRQGLKARMRLNNGLPQMFIARN